MICTYERPIYEDPASGFCIYSFTTKDEGVPMEARNPRSYGKNPIMFTATGYRLPKSGNIDVEMDGEWVRHERYGWQMSVLSCVELVPPTREGILGYLSSGLIKGIGRKTAEKIVDRFGLEALDILDASPERLKEIGGITETKLKDIQESYVLTRSLKEMMTLLSPYGITVKQAAQIQTAFGADTMEVLRHCPYKLCRVQGFGFKTVDEIARKTGCNPDDPLRVQRAMRYILDMSAVSGGHLYLPVNDLTQKTYRLLNQGFTSEAVSISMIRENVRCMVQENILVQDGEQVYLRSAYWQERNTAHNIARIVSYRAMGVDIEKELTEVQETLGYCLSAMQIQGVISAFSHSVSIITGGPGTGKTTLINAILSVFRKVNPTGQVLLAAPTGRASRRMAECTGQEACTLHSALGLFTNTEDDGEGKQADFLYADLIIIDECSMLDMWLSDKLFSNILPRSRLVLVGDADQLPSVGAGNVFRELISCGMIPVTVLDAIFRQAEGSGIILNAQAMKNGRTDLRFGSDFALEPCPNEEQAARVILKAYQEAAKANGAESVQVLCPLKKRGAASSASLNELIQQNINPAGILIPEMKFGAKTFRVGDRVMHNKNSEDASNGDVGTVESIHRDEEGYYLNVRYPGGRMVAYSHENLSLLELAYAITVHKSQGSEYDTVIVPLLVSQQIMLSRKLLYTAVTRARKKVILVGQKAAVVIAIRRNDTDQRNTSLGSRIAGACLKDIGQIA